MTEQQGGRTDKHCQDHAPDTVICANPLAHAPTPGLRITRVARDSLLLLSGIVGMGGLVGCAGLPLRMQDRLLEESDGLPTWTEIVEAEREAAAAVGEAVPETGEPAFFERTIEDDEVEARAPRSLMDSIFEPRRDPAFEREILPDAVRLGMSEDEVLDAWGEPREVEAAGSTASGSQRFIYPTSVLPGMGEERIVYFEGGRVAGWETVRR